MRFRHLEYTGYTYLQHFKISMSWALSMFRLCLCAVCHAFWPDIFTNEVSESIIKFAEKIKETQKK